MAETTTVWICTRGWSWESSEIVKIVDSEEKARRWIENMILVMADDNEDSTVEVSEDRLHASCGIEFCNANPREVE